MYINYFRNPKETLKHVQWEDDYSKRILAKIEDKNTLKPQYQPKKRSESVDTASARRTTPKKRVVEIVDVRFKSTSHTAKINKDVKKKSLI